MNKRELEEAIREEVAEWPDVSVEFVAGGNHPKAKLTFGGQSLFRAFGGNQSFVAYPHKMIADMRSVMVQLGATRREPEPAKEEVEQRYRKRNEEGVARRPDPVQHDPVEPKPDIADQMAGVGLITQEAASAVRAERTAKPPLIVIADEEEGEEEDDAAREAELAALQAEIDAIEDGIYFDLRPEVYHAVPRLGSGSLADLAVSPGTFWRGSWLDPDRPELDEEQTKAQLLGKAYHVARLEPELFEALFAREPTKGDYPKKGLVTNGDQIGAALAKLGETKKRSGESVADQAQRLEDAGYQGTIFPLEYARWKADLGKRTPIAAEQWDQIVVDMGRVRNSGEIAEKLVGGHAEVSIFWTDSHGLKCKARIDYLRPDLWDDFKTFANPNRKPLAQAISDAFRFNRYYMQAVHYRDAIEAIRVGGLQIIGMATDGQRALIAAIHIRPTELECWYIFQEKGGVPNLLAREFPFFGVDIRTDYEIEALTAFDDDEGERAERARRAMSRATMLHRRARVEVEHAKRQFVLYSQVYERGRPWFPIEAVGSFDDSEFNTYWLEGKV